LKTTSVGLGRPELSNVAATPDFLTIYCLEKRTLSILMKIMLWHGSCFSLYGRIRASGDLVWAGLAGWLGGRLGYEE
jgi:hypothetical protein